MRDVQAAASDANVEVVYLQPQESIDDRVISFGTVAEYLETLDDPFAVRFAKHVRGWISLRQYGRPGPSGARGGQGAPGIRCSVCLGLAVHLRLLHAFTNTRGQLCIA